jgi:hypothetical protein
MGLPRPALTLAAAAVILALSPPAHAQTPPQLVSVSQSGGRISATWTLPAGVVAWNLWTVPDRANFTNSAWANPIANETATSWTSTERASSGFWFVMVEGYDNACLCEVRSNVMRVQIPNRRPRIASGRVRAVGLVHYTVFGDVIGYTTEVSVRLRVCDDSRGRVVFRIRQVTDGRVRAFTRRRATDDFELCEAVRLEWKFAGRLKTIQRFRIAVRVIDRHGLGSAPYRFNLDD